jgi:hypothetical protein
MSPTRFTLTRQRQATAPLPRLKLTFHFSFQRLQQQGKASPHSGTF